MSFNRKWNLVFAFCLAAWVARADSLKLKNGSLINGKFIGGTESEISFQKAGIPQELRLVVASEPGKLRGGGEN